MTKPTTIGHYSLATRRRPPRIVRFIRLGFQVGGRVTPALAARWAYKLWFQTRRFPEPLREMRWRAKAASGAVPFKGGKLPFYAWGEGPTVLLLHGWNGRGTQLAGFAAPLVAAGFRAVAFDAPAHGRSPGTATNVFECVEALETVAQTHGPVHGIIAHSFGVVCATMALQRGLSAGRMVGISPPTQLRWMADRFADRLAIPPRVQARFEQRVEAEFGAEVWDRVAADRLATELDVPALIIHDAHDEDVPWQQGERLAQAWPGARFVRTEGLGHRRILRSPRITEQAVAFLRDRGATATGTARRRKA